MENESDLSGISLDIEEFGISYKTVKFKKSSDDPKVYTAKTKISNDDGFGELRIGIKYSYRGFNIIRIFILKRKTR